MSWNAFPPFILLNKFVYPTCLFRLWISELSHLNGTPNNPKMNNKRTTSFRQHLSPGRIPCLQCLQCEWNSMELHKDTRSQPERAAESDELRKPWIFKFQVLWISNFPRLGELNEEIYSVPWNFTFEPIPIRTQSGAQLLNLRPQNRKTHRMFSFDQQCWSFASNCQAPWASCWSRWCVNLFQLVRCFWLRCFWFEGLNEFGFECLGLRV